MRDAARLTQLNSYNLYNFIIYLQGASCGRRRWRPQAGELRSLAQPTTKALTTSQELRSSAQPGSLPFRLRSQRTRVAAAAGGRSSKVFSCRMDIGFIGPRRALSSVSVPGGCDLRQERPSPSRIRATGRGIQLADYTAGVLLAGRSSSSALAAGAQLWLMAADARQKRQRRARSTAGPCPSHRSVTSAN